MWIKCRGLLLSVLVGMALLGCGSAGIVEHENFEAIAEQHRSIAIFPFWVDWVYSNEAVKKTPQEKKRQSFELQKHLHNVLKERGLNSVRVQNIIETNQVLDKVRAEGKFSTEYFLDGSIAKRLGVDALVLGKVVFHVSLDKPKILDASEEDESQNRPFVNIDLSIYDAQTGKRIWSMNRDVESIFSDLEKVAGNAFDEFFEYFPYAE